MTTTPQSITTTIYGVFPTYLVDRPYATIAAAISTVASSTDFAAGHTTALNRCMATFVALGIWATS
jgi:hypothetical protein